MLKKGLRRLEGDTGTQDGHTRGEIRLTEDGLVIITPLGVYATTDDLCGSVIAIDDAGAPIDRPDAVPRLDGNTARAILLGESQ